MQRGGPLVVRNPSDDDEFGRAVDEAIEAGGVRTPTELQRVLRRQYPRAVARARDLEGEREVIWYVYREGRWISGRQQDTNGTGRREG